MRDQTPSPRAFIASVISSSALGSSMVAGMVHGSLSAIFLIVLRKRKSYAAASGV